MTPRPRPASEARADTNAKTRRPVSRPVPPTAVRGSAATATSCAPRRSSSKRFLSGYVLCCCGGAEWIAVAAVGGGV